MAEREGVAFDLSVTSVIDTASEEILKRTEANARAVLRAFRQGPTRNPPTTLRGLLQTGLQEQRW